MELMMEKRTDLEERSMKNLRITGTFPAKGKKKEPKKQRDENAEERSDYSLKVSQKRLKRLIWAYPGKIPELQDR